MGICCYSKAYCFPLLFIVSPLHSIRGECRKSLEGNNWDHAFEVVAEFVNALSNEGW